MKHLLSPGRRNEKRTARAFLSALLMAGTIVQTGLAQGAELIRNGGFEADFSPYWPTMNSGAGAWSRSMTTGVSPLSGMLTTRGTYDYGNHFAIYDAPRLGRGGVEPASGVLLQPFFVSAAQAITNRFTLSFDLFANNYGPDIVGPQDVLTDLSQTTQHGRVDLVRVQGPLSLNLSNSSVVRNLFLGSDAGPDPNPFKHHSFDITDDVMGGGSFAIRFAVANTVTLYVMGVDNVSVQSDLRAPASSVSEPGSLALLGLGLAGLALRRRRA